MLNVTQLLDWHHCN